MMKILRGSLLPVKYFYYEYPEGIYRSFEAAEICPSDQHLEYCQSTHGDTLYCWSSYSESLTYRSVTLLRVDLGEGASEYIER